MCLACFAGPRAWCVLSHMNLQVSISPACVVLACFTRGRESLFGLFQTSCIVLSRMFHTSSLSPVVCLEHVSNVACCAVSMFHIGSYIYLLYVFVNLVVVVSLSETGVLKAGSC